MTESTGDDGQRPTGEDADTIEVVHDPGLSRFELRDGERVIGVATYVLVRGAAADATDADATDAVTDRVVFVHTEVHPEYEGRGLAARLAEHALSETVASGRGIVALCPYIRAYLRRHPEPYAAHVLRPTDADVDAADEAARAASR